VAPYEPGGRYPEDDDSGEGQPDHRVDHVPQGNACRWDTVVRAVVRPRR
jgi:hypothetical protein